MATDPTAPPVPADLTVVEVQQNMLAAINALLLGAMFGVQGAQNSAQTDATAAGAYVSVAAQAATAAERLGALLVTWQQLPVKNPQGDAPNLYDDTPPAPAP